MMLLMSCAAWGHDIPADVRIVAFVKPEGNHLVLLLRVPMSAMREVDVPMRGPGYLDLARAEPALRQAAQLWLTDNLLLFENGARLANPVIDDVRVSLASDRSFSDYAAASAHLREPRIPESTQLYWTQQLLDARIEWPIGSAGSSFAMQPRFEKLGLRVVTTIHFLPSEGVERVFEVQGDPGVIALDPSWHQAALRFVREGFLHILDGIDHLLFVACLVIPFRRLKPLIVIATAFTVAHSITLACAATGIAPDGLWFPPLVETLIAASVFYLAIENLFGSSAQRRWIIAFAFGLVHGFGFAFALRESLQFAGAHLVTALVAFNLGVELGQIAVLLVLVPVLDWAFRHVNERLGIVVLSALIAHTAWHWMLERGAELRKFAVPALDAASAASLMRWTIGAVVLGIVLWLVSSKLGPVLRRGDDARDGDAPSADPLAGVAEDAHPR